MRQQPQISTKETGVQPSKQPSDYSATELGQMLARGEINAVDLTEHFISRVQAHGDSAVFITTTFERAREEAAASAARYQRGCPLGALDGVPIAWKDAVDIKGTPTTAGSAIYRDAPAAAEDAPVVARLAAAGMVTLGKTNLSEFAYSALGLNPHYGTPLNPRARDVRRAPGGSSSGSGVAVGARLAPVAIGTDTGGSVRVPAAFNGVVGYKTSETRYDRRGVFPLSQTLDTVGVLAHTVSDCFLVDQALRGGRADVPATASGQSLQALTLVVPANVVLDDLEPEVQANFTASLDRLSAAGVKVLRRHVPELDELKALSASHGFLASAEAYCWHHDLLESSRSGEVDPFVYKRIMAGKGMSAYDLLRLQQGRAKLGASLRASMGEAMLVMPTVAHVAPPLAALEQDMDHFVAVNSKTIRNTMWGNMLNICALALPNGLGAAGMPTSIVFAAGAEREDFLLDCGLSLANVIQP
ncbi:amidase [Alcaligenaceae bacterium]|nr:amidase [Alcaligenaceae bacterium]